MLLAQSLHRLDVTRLRGNNSGIAHDRFHDYASNLMRSENLFDERDIVPLAHHDFARCRYRLPWPNWRRTERGGCGSCANEKWVNPAVVMASEAKNI